MGRRTFSKEYKLQTTRQVIKEGKRTAEVSASLGITEQTIYRWLREYDKYGEMVRVVGKGFGSWSKACDDMLFRVRSRNVL